MMTRCLLLSATIAQLFSASLDSSFPSWNGKDTLPITRWLTLAPVVLSDSSGKPLVHPAASPDSGARLLQCLFNDDVLEEDYVLAPRKAGELYAHAHWKNLAWDTLSADSTGACRLDLRFPAASSNAIAFAVAEFASAKAGTAVLDFSIDDGALIWLNGEALVCLTGNRDLAKAGFATSRPVRLAKGRNRIIFKLDNRDGPLGVRLRIRPWSAPEKPVIKRTLSPAERRTVAQTGRRAQTLTAPDPALIRAIPKAQDSLALIMDHLFRALPAEHTTWLLTRNRRYGLSFQTSAAALSQAVRAIGANANPLPRMKGPFGWAYWSEMTGSVVPFHAYVPEGYTPSRRWPLAVVLHGAGGISFQNLEFLVYGTLKPPRDMILLSPSGRGSNGYYGPGERDVLDLIRLMKANFAIDSDRVILTGTSMGGMGTLRHLAINGDLFSCGAPFCGMAVASTAFSLTNRPLWTFHGDLDQSVPWLYSAQLEALLKGSKPPLRFTTFRNAGHAIGEEGYSDSLLRWMAAQKRPDLPPKVRLSGWELRPVRLHWLEYRAPLRTFYSYRLEAGRTGNRLVVSTANVRAFALLDPRILKGVTSLSIDGRPLARPLTDSPVPIRFTLSPSGDWTADTAFPSPRAFNYGGVRSLLNRPLVSVYSTRDPARSALCRAVATQIARVEFGGFPVVADTAFRAQAFKGRNLFFAAANLSDSLPGVARAASFVPAGVNDTFALAGPARHLLLHAPLPDTSAEIGLFVAGDRIGTEVLEGFDLSRGGLPDAMVLDSNLAAETVWYLRQDWSPVPSDPRFTLTAPTPEALARAVADGLRKSLAADLGLMFIDPAHRVAGTRTTNIALKHLLGEEGPVVLDIKGSDLLALLDNPGLKRPKQKSVVRAYLTGLSREKIEPGRTYSVASTTRAFHYTLGSRLRATSAESAFDLF